MLKKIKRFTAYAAAFLAAVAVALLLLSLAMRIYTGGERMVMVPTEKSYPTGVTELEARCFTPWLLNCFSSDAYSRLYRLSEDEWEPVEENIKGLSYRNTFVTFPLLPKTTLYLTNWYPEGVPPGRYRLALAITGDYFVIPLTNMRVYDVINKKLMMSPKRPYMAFCVFEVTE